MTSHTVDQTPSAPASVADQVRRQLGDLTPQERKVARAVLADYPRAALMSSGDLATLAGVSPPTVVRFARSLGFGGLVDLQSCVVDEMSERMASPVSRFGQQAPLDDAWPQQMLSTIDTGIVESLARIPSAELERAVALLADPKLSVSAFGGRYSGLIARYLILHLQQLRQGVLASDDLTLGDVADAVDADRRRVFVVYDLRRYQRSTVERAKRVADAGARIVCVTDPWLSPVAKVAEVVLPTSVSSAGAFDSAASAFVLTEILVDGVLHRLGDRAEKRMRRWEHESESLLVSDPGAPGSGP